MIDLFSSPLGFLPFGGIGPWEMAIIGIVAVLLFGKRLPDVGRNLGRSLMEFKKGISELQNEVNNAGTTSRAKTYRDPDEREEATAPKFEPPPAEDTATAEATTGEQTGSA